MQRFFKQLFGRILLALPLAASGHVAVAQNMVLSGDVFLPRPVRAATVYESWRQGDAEFMRAQAWSARVAAEARSEAIKAEAAALELRERKNELLQAKFAASQAEHEARKQRGRETLAAKRATAPPATFHAIDVAHGCVRWPEALQGEQYATACRSIDAAVGRSLLGNAPPTPHEALAVVEPLRNRIDAEYEQKTLKFDTWIAARHTLDDVQRELRCPRTPPSGWVAEAQ